MQIFPPSPTRAPLALTSFLFPVLSLLFLLQCHLFSSLTRQLSFATLLACLSLPSPVTLEGFNHQLNVTPYLRNAWKHTHTATLLPRWLVILHLPASLAFLQVVSKLKGMLDKAERPHMQTAELCLHMLACYAHIFYIVGDEYILDYIAPWNATITWVKMSGRCESDAFCFFLLRQQRQADWLAQGLTDISNGDSM